MTADGEQEDALDDAQAEASPSRPRDTRGTITVASDGDSYDLSPRVPIRINGLVPPELLRSVRGLAGGYDTVAGLVPKIDYGGLSGVGVNALSGLTGSTDVLSLVKSLGVGAGALSGIHVPSIAKGIFTPLDALGAAAGFLPDNSNSPWLSAGLPFGRDFMRTLEGVLPANSLVGTIPSWLPQIDYKLLGPDVGIANGTLARIAELELGFLGSSGTSADAFGLLDSVVNSDIVVSEHLKRAVKSTQRPASFRLDYTTLQTEAAELADRFEGAPEVEKEVRAALEPVQEITGLTDERLIDLGEMLGLWRRVRRHKVSSAGLILGCTVGLASYVAHVGTGTPVPPALLEALVFGGSLYGFVHGVQHKE